MMERLRRLLPAGPPEVKVMVMATVAVLAPAAPVLAVFFTWLGGSGQFSDEDNCGSFNCPYAVCYPQTTDDDALISDDVPVTVTLTEDLDIDDLTLDVEHLEGGLTLTAGGTAYTISPDTVTYSGGPVVMTGLAGIVTRDDDDCSEE